MLYLLKLLAKQNTTALQENNIQDKVFDLIINQFHRKSDAVQAISNILQIGKDSTYRRLRGDTFLTIQECQLLAQHFHLSLDQLVFDHHDTVLFQFPPLAKSIKQFDDFLKFVYNELYEAAQQPNPHIYYTSMEMPFFYYFMYPELASFKLFVWGHTFWEFEYLKNEQFHFEVLPHTTQLLVKEVLEQYMKIESSHFFHLSIVDTLLNQIQYFLSSGKFKNSNDAITLYDRLSELCGHIKNMAIVGYKFKPGQSAKYATTPFHLYHNEMIHTTNTILSKTGGSSALFSSFDNPNYLKCVDDVIISHTVTWIEKLISKSTKISRGTERQRDWYFNMLEKRIQESKQRVAVSII